MYLLTRYVICTYEFELLIWAENTTPHHISISGNRGNRSSKNAKRKGKGKRPRPGKKGKGKGKGATRTHTRSWHGH